MPRVEINQEEYSHLNEYVVDMIRNGKASSYGSGSLSSDTVLVYEVGSDPVIVRLKLRDEEFKYEVFLGDKALDRLAENGIIFEKLPVSDDTIGLHPSASGSGRFQ